MSQKDYSTTVHINATPERIFQAITVEVDQWWTKYTNKAEKVGDTLAIRFDVNTRKEMLITTFEPFTKLIWQVTHAYMDIDWMSNKNEWVGTEMHWEVIPKGEESQLNFVHKGLTPALECYEACDNGWTYFLKSLKDYLEKGEGTPHEIV